MWIGGQRWGLGILYDKFNRRSFYGEMVANMLNGDGIFYYKWNYDGFRVQYEGNFKDGLFHGNGVEFNLGG